MQGNTATYFENLHETFTQFVNEQVSGIDPENALRIDLHCHDKNSDTPDELWGRLLRLPETWLKTKTLIKQLERSGCSLLTITNHNNARSCWPLVKERDDFLVGAEFTCHFPDIDLSVHVLCYGFSAAQETTLNELRHNAYDFVRYAKQQELPLILPHPLFFYSRKVRPSLEVLERFAVMFERFEVLNGQRGVWQNSLTRDWVKSLTKECIDAYAAKHGLDPYDFCFDPYNKRMTGGSDDHNGLFAGQCGTLIEVPNLASRMAAGEKRSELAKEALLHGRIAPFGEVGEEEKLTTTFLDYFAQVVLNMKDPGLIRMFLHKGSTTDKLACLAISNGVQELQRHKYTLKFLETFHLALQGKKPNFLVSLNTTKEFKPVLRVVKAIAKAKREDHENFASHLRQLIPELQLGLSKIFFDRLNNRLGSSLAQFGNNDAQLKHSLKNFEIPTHFRGLVARTPKKQKHMSTINVGELFDQLSFPALAAGLVLGAGFMGTQVLYSNRQFISELGASLGDKNPEPRVLWLTDTLVDKNGVSTALTQTLISVRKLGLPIDILTCHPSLDEAPHLKVVRPISELCVPNFDDQVIYVPDILKIQKIFEQGGYDQIICSTELLMGGVALYLKHAFSVTAHFFMHTDWLAFAEQRIQPNPALHDRLRRMLRGFYQAFDGVVTLNQEHQEMLMGPEFDLPESKVLRSAHWPAEIFTQVRELTPLSQRPKRIIYTGRLSPEKGVGDLPKIWQKIVSAHPDAQLVLAGTGPMEAELKAAMPEAIFTGWLSHEELIDNYGQSRCQILPSRFDTFGCVVTEAMSLGVPTFAYDCKGPASIIENHKTGKLAKDAEQLAAAICEYLEDDQYQTTMSSNALDAALRWQDSEVLKSLLSDIYTSR